MPLFKGTSVHDGWRSYFLYEDCCHALCNVHHLRELVFLHETYQQEWAADLNKLLLVMKERVQEAKQRGESQLDPLTWLTLQGENDRLLQEGWRSNPPLRLQLFPFPLYHLSAYSIWKHLEPPSSSSRLHRRFDRA